MFPFVPLYFNRSSSRRLIYEFKAAITIVEFTHLWALQTHLRTLNQIKAATAIQESITYLYFNQKNQNDRWLQTLMEKQKCCSCFKHCMWHYHFILQLVSLLTREQNLLTFPSISSVLGLSLTTYVIFEAVLHAFHASLT